MEAPESLAISSLDVIEGARVVDPEEWGDHAADPTDHARNVRHARSCLEAGLEALTESLQPLVERRILAQGVERRAARGHRRRASRERTRLVDRTRRSDLLHEVAPAPVGADGEAAADHLAE